MAVTRESYIAQSPWDAVQLANLFRLAFIDAGYMTEWYDSFESGGIAHRILEITYNGSKVFGKTYYWFLFTNNTWHFSIATGWNSTTHLPIGTLDLDHRNTSTTTTSRHLLMGTLNTLTTVTLTRWTSGIDTDFSYFLLKNGTIEIPFHINLAPPVSWVDLDKVCYHSFGYMRIGNNNYGAWLKYTHREIALRRSWVSTGSKNTDSGWSGGEPGIALFPDHGGATHGYFIPGEYAGGGFYEAGNLPTVGHGVFLPAPRSYSNPAYSTTQTPIYSNLLLSLYSNSTLPSDFGFTGYIGSTTMASFDQYIVTPTSESWDIIQVVNSGSAPNFGSLSVLFLARMV